MKPEEDFTVVMKIANQIAKPYKIAMWIFVMAFFVSLGVIVHLVMNMDTEVTLFSDHNFNGEVTQLNTNV